ncbi:phytochrome sensor protein, partial [Pseudomonas sp. MWU13-2625]
GEIPDGPTDGDGPGVSVFDAVDDNGATHECRARLAPP